jgi:hypothetical protein
LGLSIQHSGLIKDALAIHALTAEVQEVCNIMQWPSYLFDDSFVTGIAFSPKDCEPLFLTFNKNNELVSPISLHCQIEPATTISVKTQYAGVEVHKAVIKLLKHLKNIYFESFELEDEGGYWPDLNKEQLNLQFERYNFYLDSLCETFEGFEANVNDTPESLAERLEVFLKNKIEGK